MGLKKPRVGAVTIHRRIAAIARGQSWRVPSYGTVRAILARLDPALVTLAQDGAAAFRDRYELIYPHRAAAPNALWQADHTLLDIMIRDQDGKPVRPWLTTVIDDHFQGLRSVAPTLAAYVGESVTLRYDPRDLSEIRVFHRDAFLCRAVSEEHAGETVTLKDIAAARRAYGQALRATITERVARVADFLPRPAPLLAPPARRVRLHLYRDDVP